MEVALPAYEPRYPVVRPIFGFFVFGVFSGYAVYLPERFPTHIRSTTVGFCAGSARMTTTSARSSPGFWSAPSAAAQPGDGLHDLLCTAQHPGDAARPRNQG